jgi:hypothetical protein
MEQDRAPPVLPHHADLARLHGYSQFLAAMGLIINYDTTESITTPPNDARLTRSRAGRHVLAGSRQSGMPSNRILSPARLCSFGATGQGRLRHGGFAPPHPRGTFVQDDLTGVGFAHGTRGDRMTVKVMKGWFRHLRRGTLAAREPSRRCTLS